VILAEGTVIDGDLHLQVRVAHHDGPETPEELLNRHEPFFAMSLAHGEVVFVSKAQVAAVSWKAPADDGDPERQSIARLIGLEITMRGGAEYRGHAVSELPPTRARASDFLNSAEQFFTLVADDCSVCIHRAYVRVARPLN
jgi:hypothetical protein